MENEVSIVLKIFKVIGFIILGAIFVTVAIFVTQYLWNWLVPDLFNGPEISFWQTAGLLALSKILFSGLGCHHKDKKEKMRCKKEGWKDRLHKKKLSWKDEIRNEIADDIKKDFESKKEGDSSIESSTSST